MIGSYIGELSTDLRGPRRVKLDLLAGSRDVLADAAEAYERQGMAPPEAERRAVEEFGDLPQLVPAYQEELAMARRRRTALVVLLTLAVQHTAAEVPGRRGAARPAGGSGGPARRRRGRRGRRLRGRDPLTRRAAPDAAGHGDLAPGAALFSPPAAVTLTARGPIDGADAAAVMG